MSSELDRLIKDNSLSNGLPRPDKKKTALLTGVTGQVSCKSFPFYVWGQPYYFPHGLKCA